MGMFHPTQVESFLAMKKFGHHLLSLVMVKTVGTPMILQMVLITAQLEQTIQTTALCPVTLGMNLMDPQHCHALVLELGMVMVPVHLRIAALLLVHQVVAILAHQVQLFQTLVQCFVVLVTKSLEL